MGKRTTYAPGTFSWVDLATTDAAAARSFYSGVFGWDLDDTDAGGGTVYTMCLLDGDAVCGLFEVPEEKPSAGVPPGWMNHVTVTDADAAAARVQELGGDVISHPADVSDAGRTAVLQDPQGAQFAVWQPRTRLGAERVNDVGCLCMNELATPDVAAARSFYERLFGWTVEVSDSTPDGPHMVFNGEHVNGSFFAAPERTAGHWRPCFTVASTQETLERVRRLGGQQLRDPVDIGHGTIAMVRDPQGALFTVFAGETDP
jgi:predicted enzyme related to lactoylglutathione lyase